MPNHLIRRPTSQQGNAFVEFALCMAFLTPLLAGAFSTGLSLVKSIQVGEVCRVADVLNVRGINLAQTDNQQLVIKAAQGLGMNQSGSFLPNPSGNGVVILTRVYRVDSNDCLAQGVAATSSACPNLNYYVITNRIIIGNSALFTSVTGNPATTPDSAGNIDPKDYTLNTGNRALDFPDPTVMSPSGWTSGLLYLDPGSYTFVSEAAVNISALNLFPILQTPMLYARDLS
jgi:Flp pilus assembly protein TadG